MMVMRACMRSAEMLMNNLLIGAGTYGEVYLHYLQASGVVINKVLDDDERQWGRVLGGVTVVGGTSLMADLGGTVFAPIGDNGARRRILQKARGLGLRTPNFIHPSAVIAEDLSVGQAFYALPGVIVMPFVQIGDDVMLSMGAKVAHHSQLGDGVFMSTNSAVGANTCVEAEAYLGMAATLVTGKCRYVGCQAYIGAGSNVICDVPANATVVGNPARPLIKN